MRPNDRGLFKEIEDNLQKYERDKRQLVGITDQAYRLSFIEQLLESIHRVKYPSVILARKLSKKRGDPDDGLFDPLLAAVIHMRAGHIDEAFWLVFLLVHFGRHRKAGWRYAREVYGRLGEAGRWDWASTSSNPSMFREWLNDHQNELRRAGVPRGFGNHRKYVSLNAMSSRGTGAAIESYVKWVGTPRTHRELFDQIWVKSGEDPRKSFDLLYYSMEAVVSFGRLGRFDYLTMVGKLGLAEIEPGSTYLGNSGPVEGAKLLFGVPNLNVVGITILEAWLVDLGAYLSVGMQVIEDSICNWQKSPGQFKPFRG